jgi:catechol 2,3-dioxygenase-like lactoylglutathione lyase family enzyme
MNYLLKLSYCLATVFFISNCCAQTTTNFAKPTISIGVVVEDLDKALHFYKDIIGMVEVREIAIPAEKAKRMGLSSGDSFSIKVLKLENSENATEWKLMSFGKKAAHSKQQYIPDDNGFRYVTIFVVSMKPLLERIKKHGIKMLGSTPTMLDEKRQFVLIQDPDGNFVELIGPA